MEDLISREDALKAIDLMRDRLLSLKMYGAEDVLVHYARRIIEELPAVELEQYSERGVT